MTTKEWLEKAQGYKEQIKNLQALKDEMLEASTCAAKPLQQVAVQASFKNVSEEKFLRYMEDTKCLDEEIEQLKEKRKKIIKTIYLVADSRLQRLLILRYLRNLQWEKIAEKMQFSEKWVRTKLHERALLEIEKIRGH